MAREIRMPQLGESVTEGTVGRWLKQVGDRVEKYEPLLEVVTDKVDTEITSEAEGVLLDIKVQEGETVGVGTVLAVIGEEGEALPVETAAAPATAEAAATPATAEPAVKRGDGKPPGAARISPVVARIAAEHGINVEEVPGTGRGGRVTKKDILKYIEEMEKKREEAPPPPPARPPAEVPTAVPGEILELTPMRRMIAEHMVMSKRTAPHVTSVIEVDMSAVARYRAAHKAEFERREGVKLTYMPFIIQAVAEALKKHPLVNSSFTDKGIELKKEINIGIAVALEQGLIVPVIKNAGDMSLAGLAKAVNDLATRARNRQLSPDDVQGGTFTITNHGAFGTLFGTPIINQPQAAILGTGAVQKRPVVVEVDGIDTIAIKPMMYLSLTFDHRILDGGTADPFLADVKRRLETFS
ncbi:MAG: 2-oxo acid dehydrogenase subunit E2 [Chloroflexi bacterium]|nr:MAG: 2-oxo acid dehydrogenase subunit E2 [Chloroflexota bacterium]